MKLQLLFILLTLMNISDFLSQNDSTPAKGKFEVDIYPIGVILNQGISYCQEISGTASSKNNNFELNFGYAGVLFREFDARRSFESGVEFPKFANGQINLGYHVVQQKSRKADKKSYKATIFTGYQVLKYGTNPSDYWIRDSIALKGYERVNGVIMHALIAGFRFHFIKTDTRRSTTRFLHRNSFQLCYLFNVDNKLKVNYLNLNTAHLKNPFGAQIHGAKFNYTYSRRIKGKFAFSIGTEVFFAPTIKYAPNPKFYVPRGGEKINPLFVTLKLGLRITE